MPATASPDPVCRCREGICTLCPCPCPSAVAERKGGKRGSWRLGGAAASSSFGGGWLAPGKGASIGRAAYLVDWASSWRSANFVVVAGLEEEKRREKSKLEVHPRSARGARMTFLDLDFFSSVGPHGRLHRWYPHGRHHRWCPGVSGVAGRQDDGSPISFFLPQRGKGECRRTQRTC